MAVSAIEMSSTPFSLTVPAALERIEKRDGEVSAFVCTRLDEARAEHQTRVKETPRSAIHGVPYSLKDLWDTAGIPTTGCSHRYRDRIPEGSSPVHRAFSEAGAILLGKTNASDLGLAMESQSYVGGTTKNPHDFERTAGGSSGGAAAAVADGMSAFDWGSDFGGSIRLPSAFCGVYGMRLSSEAWPVVGHFPEPPPSLRYMNGQGPITASLSGMRELLAITRPHLRTGRVRRFELRGAFVYAPEGRALGEWPSFTSEVVPRLERAVGEVWHDHGLPSAARASNIARAMYASHLEDFLDSDESLSFFGGLKSVLGSLALRGRVGRRTFHPRTAEMLLLIALGRATLYRDRVRAEEDASRFREDVSSLWDRGYVIVAPTTTFPAPRHGQTIKNWQLPTFTMPGNVADVTGLAIPFGCYKDGLPRSVQIWGPPGSEDELIGIAERMR